MRKKSWVIDLHKFVKSRKHSKFEWGVHDCTLFVADCIKVMTEKDPAKNYRNYTTKEGALTVVKQFGSLRELVGTMLGSEIPVELAKRGDVVMINSSYLIFDEYSIGICMGGIVVAAGMEGLVSHPIKDALTAWSVK